TALKRTEEELRAARDAAERASRAKSEFLANMSHELRTPLTAILAYAEILGDPRLEAADRAGHARAVGRNGEHLLHVINDLLDLAGIEAGRLELDRAPCAPWQLTEEALSAVRVQAAEKGLDLAAEPSGRVPRRVRTDARRVRQILVNLLGNAVKFSSAGRV